MTSSLPLLKNVLTPLGKSVLVPLGLTAAASATDAEKFWIRNESISFTNKRC